MNKILKYINFIIFVIIFTLNYPAQAENKDNAKQVDKTKQNKTNSKQKATVKQQNKQTDSKVHNSQGDKKNVVTKLNKQKDVIPPTVIKVVPPVYPTKAFPTAEITLFLKITVKKDGSVGDVKVEKSGGILFDQAAISSIKKWKFKPALLKNTPIDVKIVIPFKFPPRPKPKKVATSKGVNENTKATPQNQKQQINDEEDSEIVVKNNKNTKSEDGIITHPPEPAKILTKHLNQSIAVKRKFKIKEIKQPVPSTKSDNIVVTGIRKRPVVVAGEFKISHAVLTAAPKQSAGDMLKTAPGFYVGHPQGEGMANALFLRGFNAEHGQDFELWAGEVPINLPGHIHAQGYADMHFLISETIDSLKVIEGVFNPMQGDFAVAGSGYFKYGVKKRGVTIGLTYGSFNTRRLLFIYAPKGEAKDTFFATSLKTSDGFGDGNRASQAAASVGRYHFFLNPKTDVVFHVGAYGGRSVLPGVLRLDDVQSGKIGFFDTYDLPTAKAQSGFFSRFEASSKVIRKLQHKKEKITFSMYLLRTVFRLKQNFTGYLLQFPDQPDLVGAGDLHQQLNTDETYGFSLIYHSGNRKWIEKPFSYKAGVQLRSDWVSQKEDLIFPAQNMIWRHTIDTDMQLLDMGVFADSHWKPLASLDLKAGIRVDSLIYEINDNLANRQYNVPVQQNHLLGYKRDAMGLVLGPRFSLNFSPFKMFSDAKTDDFSILASYGEGYRSPQPRSLQDGERAPFTKVRSFESGIKWYLTKNHRYLLKLTGFYTYLNMDYVFDPLTAMAKEIGDTTRMGGVAFINAKPIKGMNLSASLTYAYAVLNGPPLATPDNPTPGEKKGDLIPYIPPLVGRIDFSYSKKLFKINGYSVKSKFGAGYTYLSARPLPYGEWSDPVSLLDAQATFSYKFVDFKIAVTNLLDTKWHDMEYNFVSQWDPNVPTALPARHFVAGSPRTVLATLILYF